MKLDLLTLMWVLPTASALLALTVLTAQWRTRVQNGLSLWGWGLVLHTLSYPAFGLRLAGWTDTSIVLTNLMTAGTFALHQLAMAQFQKGRAAGPSLRWIVTPVALNVLVAAALVNQDLWRNVIAALILALQSATLTWQAWGPGLAGPRERGRWLLLLGSSGMALMFGVRAVWSLMAEWNPNEAVPASIQAVTYLVALLVLLVNTQGFVLMQREHFEDSLAEQERRHRRLIEASSEGICVMDNGVLKLVNHRLCEMTGLPEHELTSRSFFTLLDPEDRERAQDIHRRRMAGRADDVRYDLRARTAQGEQRWWEIGGVAIEWQGRPATLNFIIDITQRKRAEAELQEHRLHLQEMVQARTAELSVAKEAAEAASRAKTQFLATVSHELRTPLHGILGFTELALAAAQNPRQKECLQTTIRLSRNLGRLIDDLLEVARIEANRLELACEPLTLGRVLESVRVVLEPQARAKGLAWRIDVAEDTARMPLMGDELRLGQVLLNLVSNAIKFTATGAVSLRVETLRLTEHEATLRVEVSDTGIGIAPQDQKRLFHAFEQLDAGASRQYEGTGLGLYISRMLVQAMGGQISLRSQPGQGSTFGFTVKLARGAQAAGTADAGGLQAAAERSPSSLPLLTELKDKLEAGDPAALPLLDRVLDHADPRLRQALAALREPIAAYDFDAALPPLRALLEEAAEGGR